MVEQSLTQREKTLHTLPPIIRESPLLQNHFLIEANHLLLYTAQNIFKRTGVFLHSTLKKVNSITFVELLV